MFSCKNVYQSRLLFIIVFLLIMQLLNSATSANVMGNTKIVGGTAIPISQASYQISIRRKAMEMILGFGRGHNCGGSVISQRLIISAAHCFYNFGVKPPAERSAKEYTVVMGNTQLYQHDSYTLQYNIQELLIHKDFNPANLENDIAALFITGYIPWDWPTVNAIPLNTALVSPNTLCAVTGWGKMGNGRVSSVLMRGFVPITDNRTCTIAYGRLPSSKICAGYKEGGIDACQGDSGGPLQCNGLLTGIVSYGYQCALAGYPGVYTNASYLHQWIVTTNDSLDYSLYAGDGAERILKYSNPLLTVTIVFILLRNCFFNV